MKKNINEISIEKLPAKIGSFMFKKNDSFLYSGYSSNINKTVNWFYQNREIETISPLFENATDLEFTLFDTLFEALSDHKKRIVLSQPALQSTVRYSDEFVYLAVDFSSSIDFKIENTTQEDFFYIGPFKDRFFVMDFLDTYNRLFDPVKSKSHFFKLLFDEDILTSLDLEVSNFENNLEFERADLLKTQISIFRKFKDYVRMIVVSKNLTVELDIDKDTYRLHNGLMKYFKNENTDFIEFPVSEVEYRNNEILSVDKMQLIEMKVIHTWMQSNYPKIIDQISDKEFERLRSFVKNNFEK